MGASAQAVAAGMGANNGAPSPVWLPGITPDDIQFLAANVTGLASTAPNGSSQIQVDNGYDFYWYALTHQADLAGAAQDSSSVPNPLVTVLINDSSATRNLSNVAMPLSTISGTVISFTWVSYVASGTTYSNIYHALHGYRIRK